MKNKFAVLMPKIHQQMHLQYVLSLTSLGVTRGGGIIFKMGVACLLGTAAAPKILVRTGGGVAERQRDVVVHGQRGVCRRASCAALCVCVVRRR